MLILVPLVLAFAPAVAARQGAPAVAARDRAAAASLDSGVGCRSVSVTSTTRPPSRRLFSASQTPDLQITTTFPTTLTGSRRLVLRVLTPQGYLYQRFSIPFD